jgi:integrase
MNGKRIQKSFYGKTKGEAREKGEIYKEQYKKGEIEESNVIFTEWAEKWIKTYKENKIKSSTYRFKYRSFLETHLKPYFKQVKITKIKQIDIQNFINTKAEFDKITQERYVYILKAMFESAIDNNIIYKNPVKGITLKSDIIKKEKRIYSQKEADKIVEFAKTHKYGAPIIIMLKTGLRRGELMGLKFENIDFENSIINLNGSVADMPYKGKITPVFEEDSSNTKNHNRQIPFNEIVHETLSNVKKTSEFVFPNIKGKVNSPNNYSRRQYASFMKDLINEYPEIKKLSPHELRHTCGTLMYESGVDLRVIQKIMGHVDLETTSEIYIHDNIDHMKNELKKMK